MKWLLGKTRKFHCPDGTPRLVYRDSDDAFPLFLGEWTTRVEATVKALESLQGSLGGELTHQVAGLLYCVDETNVSMQGQFRAIYVAYQQSPCTMDAFLGREVTRIIENETRLRELRMRLDHVQSLAKMTTDPALLAEELRAARAAITESSAQRETRQELERAPALVAHWSEGSECPPK